MPSVAMANGAARNGAGCGARGVKQSTAVAIMKRHALRKHARRWTPGPPFLTMSRQNAHSAALVASAAIACAAAHAALAARDRLGNDGRACNDRASGGGGSGRGTRLGVTLGRARAWPDDGQHDHLHRVADGHLCRGACGRQADAHPWCRSLSL